jgi:hypothetical protein
MFADFFGASPTLNERPTSVRSAFVVGWFQGCFRFLFGLYPLNAKAPPGHQPRGGSSVEGWCRPTRHQVKRFFYRPRVLFAPPQDPPICGTWETNSPFDDPALFPKRAGIVPLKALRPEREPVASTIEKFRTLIWRRNPECIRVRAPGNRAPPDGTSPRGAAYTRPAGQRGRHVDLANALGAPRV